MPPSMTKKLFSRLKELGKRFGEARELDDGILRKIAGREKLGFFDRFLARAIIIPMIHRFFWNAHLKKNNAMDKVFERP